MLIVTTPTVSGSRIVKHHGIVSGDQVGEGGGMLMVSASGTAPSPSPWASDAG